MLDHLKDLVSSGAPDNFTGPLKTFCFEQEGYRTSMVAAIDMMKKLSVGEEGESPKRRPADEGEDRDGSYYSDDSSSYCSGHESEGSYLLRWRRGVFRVILHIAVIEK